MNKIKFIPSHFWDIKTMGVNDFATDEQWQQVQTICDKLNIKHQFEAGCKLHPDKEQEISVGLFNDLIDFQLEKRNTCGCHDIVEKLIEIRNKEMMSFNPDSFKDSKAST